MNARVLELLKNPTQFLEEDFNLVESEIQSVPYVQSIRALYLYGIKKYQPENYENILSKTAAYTTDKKILYQFINGKIEPETKIEIKPDVDTQESREKPQETNHKKESIKAKEPAPENKKTETNLGTEEAKNTTSEQQSTTKINFHTETNFMSEVKIDSPKENPQYTAPIQQKQNRHELEMQKLLAQVEAKMKSNKKTKKESNESTSKNENQNTEISFAETTTFEIKKERQETNTDNPKPDSNLKSQISKTPKNSNQNWKPMSITTHQPDGLLSKKTDNQNIEKPQKSKTQNIEAKENTEIPETNSPVMNVSFFSPEIKTIEKENLENNTSENQKNESNIPTFINTWQSWLKIDRTTGAQQTQKEKPELPTGNDFTKESSAQIKAKAIDKFIENEPKISKLKEDSEFVVKQDKEDVSHLMTETLAKIYTEQKLYSKAIKGYKILIKKHPEKEKEFLEKIEEIKQLRGN